MDEIVGTVMKVPPRLGSVRLVAVDGPSGSGKSTVSLEMVKRFAPVTNVALVPTDHFATWEDPFGWWPRLEAQVLQPLSVGRWARYLAQDWTGPEPVASVPRTVERPSVLVLEGVSAARRAISTRAVLTCWIEVPDSITRLERAVHRDGESERVHLRRWQQDEDRWFARDGTKTRASRVRYLD